MKLALLEDHCSLGCCGRGHCSSKGCVCAEGWHGEACNLNANAWDAFEHIAKLRSQALLQEAQGKREQAEKTKSLSDMLTHAGGQHESARVATQVYQLNFDVQHLLQSAADLELQAQRMPKQNSVKVLGDVVQTCSPVANQMSSKELLSASQLTANLSRAMTSSKPVHFSGRAGMQSKANATARQPIQNKNAPPKTTEDFGIDQVNPKGVSGIQEGECSEKLNNCNFRGICKDGVCYCQKNFFGEDCSLQREKKTGTWDLGFTLMVAMGAGVVSFVLTLGFHNYIAISRRNAEAALGYTV